MGTRASALALAQSRMVAEMLGGAQLVEITTSGDRVRAAGDKSRFVKEIEEALLAGEVDLAVHSAKDVPGVLPEGLEIAAVPPRADPRDVLCGADALRPGMRVGTASIRRRSQLLASEPALEVVELRGNVDTRLRRLADGDYDAIVLAGAGLERLARIPHARAEGEHDGQGLDATATAVAIRSDGGSAVAGLRLGTAAMTPAPGQGCLALQIRVGDASTRAAVERINDPVAFACLAAERDCVIALDATCDTPIGVLAETLDQRQRKPGELRLRIRAYAGAADASAWIRDELEGGMDAGKRIAERLLAAGAAEILSRVSPGAAIRGSR